MMSLTIMLTGVLVVAVGVVITFGSWTLMPVGAVVAVGGLLVDFDAAREPKRGKRTQ